MSEEHLKNLFLDYKIHGDQKHSICIYPSTYIFRRLGRMKEKEHNWLRTENVLLFLYQLFCVFTATITSVPLINSSADFLPVACQRRVERSQCQETFRSAACILVFVNRTIFSLQFEIEPRLRVISTRSKMLTRQMTPHTDFQFASAYQRKIAFHKGMHTMYNKIGRFRVTHRLRSNSSSNGFFSGEPWAMTKSLNLN